MNEHALNNGQSKPEPQFPVPTDDDHDNQKEAQTQLETQDQLQFQGDEETLPLIVSQNVSFIEPAINRSNSAPLKQQYPVQQSSLYKNFNFSIKENDFKTPGAPEKPQPTNQSLTSDNVEEVSPSIQMGLRIFVVTTILICVTINAYKLYFENDEFKVRGVHDLVFIYTEPLNKFFLEHIKFRNYLLIFCSTEMDIMTLTSFYRFARYSTTWRFIITLLVFYVLRLCTTHIYQVEIPKGYNWAFPGVFSLVVPYGKTADFFYSGHVGSCMIQYLEFDASGWKWWSYFALFVMFNQIFLLVATRSHYSMDMLAAVIFAHYFFIMAEKYSYLVDWYIFGIPLHKRLASDGEYISILESTPLLENDANLLENYYAKNVRNQSENTPSTGLTHSQKQNHVKKLPVQSQMGRYFISCRNCHHPVSNFMLNEKSIKGVTPVQKQKQQACNHQSNVIETKGNILNQLTEPQEIDFHLTTAFNIPEDSELDRSIPHPLDGTIDMEEDTKLVLNEFDQKYLQVR